MLQVNSYTPVQYSDNMEDVIPCQICKLTVERQNNLIPVLLHSGMEYDHCQLCSDAEEYFQ